MPLLPDMHISVEAPERAECMNKQIEMTRVTIPLLVMETSLTSAFNVSCLEKFLKLPITTTSFVV